MSDTTVTLVFNCKNDKMRVLVDELKGFVKEHDLGAYFVLGEDVNDYTRSLSIEDA